MFATLLFFHSMIRWVLLAGLTTSLYRGYRGYTRRLPFGKTDNSVRHWTATTAHIQLLLGIYMYTQSGTVKALLSGAVNPDRISDPVFFGIIHISLMLIAIILVTIGSAKAKRQSADTDKFKTVLIWFAVALLLILIAIPWPFSPLAYRPYFRSF